MKYEHFEKASDAYAYTYVYMWSSWKEDKTTITRVSPITPPEFITISRDELKSLCGDEPLHKMITGCNTLKWEKV